MDQSLRNILDNLRHTADRAAIDGELSLLIETQTVAGIAVERLLRPKLDENLTRSKALIDLVRQELLVRKERGLFVEEDLDDLSADLGELRELLQERKTLLTTYRRFSVDDGAC